MRNIIMRTFIKIILLLSATALLNSAEVNLNLDYNVDGQKFKLNSQYKNELGIKYQITRLDFYMCGFKLDDLELDNYILATGDYENYTLGEHDVNNVENLTISFGVKKEDNIGQDPNKYGPLHPLAPKNPSMHWGWAAGYRFWVVEGFVDSDNDGQYDKSFQYHILGDEAFRTISLKTNANEKNGVIDLNINFNIQKLLKSIDMTKFGAYHDFYNNSQELRDFINNIISSGAITSEVKSSVEDSNNDIRVYPNPTSDILNISSEFLNKEYNIFTLDGISVSQGVVKSSSITLDKLVSGTYLIKIFDDKGIIKIAKFVKN